MAISLQKGQTISLRKADDTLRTVVVGLGWDAAKSGLFGKTKTIDCDAFAFLVTEDKSRVDTVYFGDLVHHSGAVQHMGDNLTGDGDGDDERIVINLEKVPAHFTKIVVGVNIFNGKTKGQSFAKVKNAFVRLVNDSTREEICRYDLSGDKTYANSYTMFMCEIYRHGGEWKVRALGNPCSAVNIKDAKSEI